MPLFPYVPWITVNSTPPDSLYEPFVGLNLWMPRLQFLLGIVIAGICQIEWQVRMTPLLLTVALFWFAFEFFIFQYKKHRRTIFLQGQLRTAKVIGKRVTWRGQVCKVEAEYSVEGDVYRTESAVSANGFSRLKCDEEFQVKVLSSSPSHWVII